MGLNRLLPGVAVVAPTLQDAHGLVHRVANVRLMTEYYQTFGYAENWQLVVACKPYRKATAVLELRGRPIDKAILGDETRGAVVTCLACVCGINIREW